MKKMLLADDLKGFMIVSTEGAVFQMPDMPNVWPSKATAMEFIKKYSLGRSYKPYEVSIRFKHFIDLK